MEVLKNMSDMISKVKSINQKVYIITGGASAQQYRDKKKIRENYIYFSKKNTK